MINVLGGALALALFPEQSLWPSTNPSLLPIESSGTSVQTRQWVDPSSGIPWQVHHYGSPSNPRNSDRRRILVYFPYGDFNTQHQAYVEAQLAEYKGGIDVFSVTAFGVRSRSGDFIPDLGNFINAEANYAFAGQGPGALIAAHLAQSFQTPAYLQNPLGLPVVLDATRHPAGHLLLGVGLYLGLWLKNLIYAFCALLFGRSRLAAKFMTQSFLALIGMGVSFALGVSTLFLTAPARNALRNYLIEAASMAEVVASFSQQEESRSPSPVSEPVLSADRTLLWQRSFKPAPAASLELPAQLLALPASRTARADSP